MGRKASEIHTKSSRLCMCCAVVLWAQLLVFLFEDLPGAVLIMSSALRTLLTLLMVMLRLMPQRNAEVFSVVIYSILVLIFPLLNVHRVSLLLGMGLSNLEYGLERNFQQSDSILMITITCVVCSFVLLIPVRSRYGCVVPSLVPLAYFLWTLPFPPDHGEGFINRLLIGVSLSFLVSVVAIANVFLDMHMREHFIQSSVKDMEILESAVGKGSQSPGSTDSTSDTRQAQFKESHELEMPRLEESRVETVSSLGLSSFSDDCDAHPDTSGASELIEKLELQVLACRLIGDVGAKAVTRVCEQKHWHNTRDIINRMNRPAAHKFRKESRSSKSSSRSSSSSCSTCSLEDSKHPSLMTPDDQIKIDESVLQADFSHFQGAWKCCNDTSAIPQWLHSLDISGSHIVDGEGDVSTLERDEKGDTRFIGRKLYRQGQYLCVRSKRGSTFTYCQD